MRRTSAGAVGGAQSERWVSVYTVAVHEPGPLRLLLLVQPVPVYAVGRAESVSVDPPCRAELVAIYAVGRVQPVSVYPVGGTEPVALHTVGRGQPVVRGVSVNALGGAEADHRPGAAARPQGGVADDGQSPRNLQQRATAAGAQRRHGACMTRNKQTKYTE